MFALTLPEFYDMVNAKLTFEYLSRDKEYERTAWQTSLLMTATGNYGKKGIDAKKLYKRLYDDLGRPLETDEVKSGGFTSIEKTDKDNKLNELFAKFNK